MLSADLFRDPVTGSLRDKAGQLYRTAIEAVDPARLTLNTIAGLPSAIRTALLKRRGQLVLVAAGKAALGMAAGAEDGLPIPAMPPGKAGRRFVPPPKPYGIAVTKDGAVGPALRHLQVRRAGHPAPDARSVAAADEALRLLVPLDEGDVAILLISGGASALLSHPVEGVSLEDVRETGRLLALAGAPIQALNAVRKHLSRTAGGRLAAAAHPASVLAFVMSDVPTNRLDTIGSGPSVPDPSTFEDALKVVDRAGVREKMPKAALAYLELGRAGKAPETLKPQDPSLDRTRTLLVGSSRTALEAAADQARKLGYKPIVLEDELLGEARAVGTALGKRLKELVQAGKGPLALIAGGETTVTVRGSGTGGRNQEVALAAALELEGVRGVALLAAATDGEDGTTDAAGGLVDGSTALRAKERGVDIAAALATNDSTTALERIGDAILKTGPSGTNVMDIAIALIA